MKRVYHFIQLLLVILMIVCSIMFSNTNKIIAQTDQYGYNFGCKVNEYEVDYITDDGNFELIDCFSDLNAAKNKMKENEDYVVRNYYNPSPMKIVAMNHGLVYAFPGRYGYSTLSVYQYVYTRGYGGKVSYTAPNYEMNYIETERVYTSNGEGVIKVNLHGFTGYTDLERCDLIPFKFIENNISCNVYTGKMKMRQNYYYAEKNGNYRSLFFVSYVAKNSNGYARNISAYAIDEAPSFMKDNIKYYSPDSIHFYSDPKMTNYAGTHYNYYEFLPVRSKTNVTAKQLKDYLVYVGRSNSAFINDTQAFIDAQNKYGINALLMFALACNESAYGTNLINTNNIFGLGAFDGAERENAYSYTSISDCVNSFAGYSIAKYCDYWFNSGLDVYNSPVFGNKGVGFNLKYASDPYECLTVSYLAYSIDRFSKNYDGTFNDRGQYERALIINNGSLIKASPNENSNTLYSSFFGYNSSYQQDHIVIVLEKGIDYTKIQCTNSINNNREVVVMGNYLNEYDYENSYGYIKTSDLNFIDSILPEKNFISKINNIELINNGLDISGIAYQKDLYDSYKINLIFEGINNYTFEATIKDDYSFNIFIQNEILNDLALGSYSLKIDLKYDNYNQYNDSFYINYLNDIKNIKLTNHLIKFSNLNNNLVIDIVDHSKKEVLIAIKKYEINDCKLYINGLVALSNVDKSVLNNDLSRELVIYDLNDEKNYYTFLINEQLDASWYNLNDGFDYSYGGFEKTIDLKDLSNGSYGIKVIVSYDNVIYESNLKSTNKNYSIILYNDSKRIYKSSTNELRLYSFELEIFNNDFNININKPNQKASLVECSNITIDDKGILTIKGRGFIYGTDFNENSKDKYQLYLVSDNGNYYKLNSVLIDDSVVNYSEILNLSYNVKNISFASSIDLNEIEKGLYKIFVYMSSNGYSDLVTLNNRFNQININFVNQNNYNISNNNTRNDIILVVDKYE